MRINKNIYRLCWFALLALLFVSCDDNDNSGEQELSRLFRPGSLTRLVEGTTVTLSWIPIKGATYYIEYGRAEAGVPFEEVEDMQSLTLGKVSSCKVDNLWGNTRYAVRLKAVSSTPGVNDSQYVVSNFTTGAENIFYPLTYGPDGNDFWILAKWDNTKEVSRLVIDHSQQGEKIILLSAAEITAGEALIKSTPDYRLRPGVPGQDEYKFSIYLGERKRGESTVRLQRGQ